MSSNPVTSEDDSEFAESEQSETEGAITTEDEDSDDTLEPDSQMTSSDYDTATEDATEAATETATEEVEVPVETAEPTTSVQASASASAPTAATSSRYHGFVPPKGANVQMGPPSTYGKGGPPFAWVGKIPATERKDLQMGTREKRPGQFRQEKAARAARLRRNPLPVRMEPKDIKENREQRIMKSIFKPKLYKLTDEDLDIPEVAEKFDRIYPALLPPLPGIRYKQGKDRVHQQRWFRRQQWDFFWAHREDEQIKAFNEKPALKSFFDHKLGKDTCALIRHHKSQAPIPVYNELELIPEGFPVGNQGDPYLNLETYIQGEVVPLELDTDTLMELAEPENKIPLVTLNDLCGPEPMFAFDNDDNYQGLKNPTVHSVAIKGTFDFLCPSSIPNPTPDQVKELMALGNCDSEAAIAYYWSYVFEQCDEAKAKAELEAQMGKGAEDTKKRRSKSKSKSSSRGSK